MKTVKRIVAVLLAVMLMAPAAVNAASPSPAKTSIKGQKATATVTYNKKTQLPTVITINGKKLVVGKDCVIVDKKGKKDPGTYTLTIKGIDTYSGKTTVTFKIKKAEQKIETSTEKKSYKAADVKKKGKTFKLNTKTYAKDVTYKVVGKGLTAKANKRARKYIKVSKSGRVTIKKGIKKGTYKVVIKTKATKYRKAGREVIKIVIK